MNPESKGSCWECGATLGAADYGRESRCPECGKATHACRNCRFYAPSRPNACAEPVAERVMEKERANFCGYFEPTTGRGPAAEASSAEDLRSAADALFKR